MIILMQQYIYQDQQTRFSTSSSAPSKRLRLVNRAGLTMVTVDCGVCRKPLDGPTQSLLSSNHQQLSVLWLCLKTLSLSVPAHSSSEITHHLSTVHVAN